jgi:glutamate-5-semialdehyde dehydrogenase
VIKHLDGVCHVYVDDSADAEMAVKIADNADAAFMEPATPWRRCSWRRRSPARCYPRSFDLRKQEIEVRADDASLKF